MSEWNELQDAYGPATEIPKLLERLSPDARNKVWGELWQRICHQGSVYSASFAAIPSLTNAAARWRPEDRPMVLALAAAIFAGDNQSSDFAHMRATYANELSSLRALTAETLRTNGIAREDFIYVLQAALAFDGIRPWDLTLDRLNDGEFEAICPNCGTPLFVAIGDYGVFTSFEDYALNENVRKGMLYPAQASELTGVGQRLYYSALEGGHPDVAEMLTYLFGTAECAGCGQQFVLPTSIEREYAAGKPNTIQD